LDAHRVRLLSFPTRRSSDLALGRGATSDLAVAGASLASTAITVAANVPLNRRLDAGGAAFWPAYARRWTRWNTTRALAAAAVTADRKSTRLNSSHVSISYAV